MSRFTHCRPGRWLIALPLLLAGCQTTRPGLVPESQVVEAMRPAQTVDNADLLPLRPRTATYQYEHSGRPEPTTVRMTVEKTLTDTWQTTFEKLSTHVFRRLDDGTMLLLMDVDHEQNARVSYDPPITWLPATLRPGAKLEGETAMTVSNLSDGSHRDRGTCIYTVELIGRQHIPTPLGWFDAHIVQMTRQIDLNLADVSVTIDIAYVPQMGMVAETVEQKIRALGLFPITKHEQYRLTDTPTE